MFFIHGVASEAVLKARLRSVSRGEQVVTFTLPLVTDQVPQVTSCYMACNTPQQHALTGMTIENIVV